METSFRQRLAKTLSRHIWRQFNIKLEFSIQIEDFHLDLPQSVSKSVPQDLPEREKIVEAIRALWTNPSNNRVIDELVTVP